MPARSFRKLTRTTSCKRIIPFWISIREASLQQGDLLPRCRIPVIPREFGIGSDTADVPYRTGTLIVITQSCDLANMKSGLVALCPAHAIQEFEVVNPRFARKGVWEEVRKGRHEGLHLLASPLDPMASRDP